MEKERIRGKKKKKREGGIYRVTEEISVVAYKYSERAWENMMCESN